MVFIKRRKSFIRLQDDFFIYFYFRSAFKSNFCWKEGRKILLKYNFSAEQTAFKGVFYFRGFCICLVVA